MFIASRRLLITTPFGGAETDVTIITQDHFRTSERRQDSFSTRGYKHLTPTV